MASSDTLLLLIDAIYAAASDPSLWPMVAVKIQRAVGGQGVNFALEDVKEEHLNYVFTNGVSEDALAYYQDTIIHDDQMASIYKTMAPGTALLTQDLWNENHLESLQCYQEFYKQEGYHHFNAGCFYRDDQRQGWISVVRSPKDSMYTKEDLVLMQALMPHLQRAFRINMQLLEAQMSSRVALDSLEHVAAATALLAKDGYVVQHNSRAEPYLDCSGSSVKELTMKLPDPSANQQLQAAIASLVQPEASGTSQDGIVPFCDSGVQKTALCFPWHSTEEQFDWLGRSAYCIVFILSPNATPPPADLLQKTFGLSKAEVKVMQKLMDGWQVKNIADSLYVSETTVRYHVRNLLQKTACNHQAEMVAKVFNTLSVRVE